MKSLLLHSFLALAFLIQVCKPTQLQKGHEIRFIAKKYINSRAWLSTPEVPDKSHLFVAKVFGEANLYVPKRNGGPIDAEEWADPNSIILSSSKCWKRCRGKIIGDVIAENGHVAIVTRYWKTTSPSMWSEPQGVVKESSWGFHRGVVCWRYRYDNERYCSLKS